MHFLSKSYKPQNCSREDFYEISFVKNAVINLSNETQVIKEERSKAIDWLKTLPKDNNIYHLSHFDLHYFNYHINGNEITAFDFDDSIRFFSPYEICICLGSFKFSPLIQSQKLPYLDFEDKFWESYLKQNTIDLKWRSMSENFDRLRNIVGMSWMNKMFSKKALETTQKDYYSRLKNRVDGSNFIHF